MIADITVKNVSRKYLKRKLDFYIKLKVGEKMNKTFAACINGERKIERLFQNGERVINQYGNIGTVTKTEDSPLFVKVEWDEKYIGKTWLATSLELINQ